MLQLASLTNDNEIECISALPGDQTDTTNKSSWEFLNPSRVFTMHRAISGCLRQLFWQILWFEWTRLITSVFKHQIDWQLSIRKRGALHISMAFFQIHHNKLENNNFSPITIMLNWLRQSFFFKTKSYIKNCFPPITVFPSVSICIFTYSIPLTHSLSLSREGFRVFVLFYRELNRFLKTGGDTTWLNPAALHFSFSLNSTHTHTHICTHRYSQLINRTHMMSTYSACQPPIGANESTSISAPHTVCIQSIPLLSRSQLQSFHK